MTLRGRLPQGHADRRGRGRIDPVSNPDPADGLSPALAALAGGYGIATEFSDWRGRAVAVSGATIRAVLAGFGVDAGTEASTGAALRRRRDEPWRRLLPPCLVVREGSSPTVNVHVPDGDPVQVWVELESGGATPALTQLTNDRPPRGIGGSLVGEASFVLPGDLPLGYHRLRARSGDAEATGHLIVTPGRLGLPPRWARRRIWGVATQLYQVRSERSWGIGDLTDLTDLAGWAAGVHGGGFVLVNPLHAAQPVAPLEPSPYLPTSRRFAHPLYLRPERIAEFADLDAAARAEIGALRTRLAADLAGIDQLDRDTSWTAKRAALQLVHAVPRSAGRELAYRLYREREGRALTDFATWSALAEQHGPRSSAWPAGFRDPQSAAVAKFRATESAAVDFQCWLQWALDEQLATAQGTAVRAGATLGIMHDLAVGVHPEGADVWAGPDVFAAGVTVGAPPDPFNQNGQDWTQPPWRPDRLAESGYEPFRAMLAGVLRSAGGLRVDHILGLFRLWWIPAGMGPAAGTYVRYDHEAMVGILALQAHRAGAVVVGEDLGTVEPWVRDYLGERGILGTSILWFENDFDAPGTPPLPPERWREYSLASVTTHDLPPTAGYLAGDHVRLRDRLGLLTRTLPEELAADRSERTGWIDELHRRGALTDAVAAALTADVDPGEPTATTDQVEATVLALHRYLTWTPARMLAVSLSDLVGDRRTQNQPGTTDEYPNWRVPLTGPDGRPVSLQDVLTSERAARLAEVLRDAVS